MTTTVKLAKQWVPVSMADDEPVLRAMMGQLAAENGCDEASVRNISSRVLDDGQTRMLLVEADADRL